MRDAGLDRRAIRTESACRSRERWATRCRGPSLLFRRFAHAVQRTRRCSGSCRSSSSPTSAPANSVRQLRISGAAIWGPCGPPSESPCAAFLAYGYRVWPAIAASAFVIAGQGAVPVLAAAGQAIAATIGAGASMVLLRRIPGFDPALSRLRDAVGFVVLGAFGGAILSSVLGTASLYVTGIQPYSGLTRRVVHLLAGRQHRRAPGDTDRLHAAATAADPFPRPRHRNGRAGGRDRGRVPPDLRRLAADSDSIARAGVCRRPAGDVGRDPVRHCRRRACGLRNRHPGHAADSPGPRPVFRKHAFHQRRAAGRALHRAVTVGTDTGSGDRRTRTVGTRARPAHS